MKGFDPKFPDFPSYIIGITKEIWEDRGIHTLNRYYGPDIPVRSPMGITRGNQAVIASTMATCHEFPDRQLFADDVIWTGDGDRYLSSHRLLTTGTNGGDGQFGPATGRAFRFYVIADCAARANTIDDEWLVRDYGALVRQLGLDPRSYAEALLQRPEPPRPFTPAIDVPGPYTGRGNDNRWGARYADSLTRIMDHEIGHILADYDRAAIGHYPGAQRADGRIEIAGFWTRLRAAFPTAMFRIHHVIGMEADMMPPRAAIRWSLDGCHDGAGLFGPPSGAPVHVMGLSHAEFGPRGLRREWTLYDEIAIWVQILQAGPAA